MEAQESAAKITYIAEHSFPNSEVYNGKNFLHLDGSRSLFVHDEYPLETRPVVGGLMGDEFMGDSEGCSVFVNLEEKVTYTKKRNGPINSTLHIIIEELEAINWKIGTESKLIGGFNAKIAHADYEGRTYEVWFTREIPFPFGPYRLQGLPGLILEAHSTDGYVKWVFHSFENVNVAAVELVPPVNGVALSWEEYVNKSLAFKEKFEGESRGNITKTVIDSDSNEEIEKGKFRIFERYLNGSLNSSN